MELKQLAQMLSKGIDEEGCAAVLNVDVSVVRQLCEEMGDKSQGSPQKGLAEREQEQLRTLFARQVSPNSCSEILHIDVESVKEFQAQENASKQGIITKASIFTAYLVGATTAKSHIFAGAALKLARNPTFQVSTASAGAGTVVGAVTGGATGTVVGGVAGAAAGTVPAIFTFGLSIPFTASIGSGIGLFIGCVSGATFGAVAGGASGYAGFTYRKEIRLTTSKLLEQACCAAQVVGGQVGGFRQKLISNEEPEVVAD
jgi:hypothetical protein